MYRNPLRSLKSLIEANGSEAVTVAESFRTGLLLKLRPRDACGWRQLNR
jgi:hypothetical protein